MRAHYFLYGNDGEYSLERLGNLLSSSGRKVTECKNWTEEDFIQSSLGDLNENLILISSAHPAINSRASRRNLPISKIRRLADWHKVGFFPHDLTDPFHWEERHYLNDYDFIFYEYKIPRWIETYQKNCFLVGVLPPSHIMPKLSCPFLFLPDDYYSFGIHPAKLFFERFPFIKSREVFTKFVDVMGSTNFLLDCRTQIDSVFLDSKIKVRDIFETFSGHVLTQGPSSVISEAYCYGIPVIFLMEKPLSDYEKKLLQETFPAIIAFEDSKEPDFSKYSPPKGKMQKPKPFIGIEVLLRICENMTGN
jgi:hypothetical protein